MTKPALPLAGSWRGPRAILLAGSWCRRAEPMRVGRTGHPAGDPSRQPSRCIRPLRPQTPVRPDHHRPTTEGTIPRRLSCGQSLAPADSPIVSHVPLLFRPDHTPTDRPLATSRPGSIGSPSTSSTAAHCGTCTCRYPCYNHPSCPPSLVALSAAACMAGPTRNSCSAGRPSGAPVVSATRAHIGYMS